MKIRAEFQKHLMNGRGDERTTEIAAACSQLVDRLEALCPPGRHRSLAITAIEQTYHWAITAAALDLENIRAPEPAAPMGGGRHG